MWLCYRWIHIKCAEINHQKYEKLKKDPLAWYCADCMTKIPFSTLSNKDFKDFLYSTTAPQPPQILQKLSKEIKKAMSCFKLVNELFDQSENSIKLWLLWCWWLQQTCDQSKWSYCHKPI